MNGVINFLKPPGMSSNGAVVFLRGMLGGEKTGHAGTLDPGACGVLPICVGRATKVSSYLMGGTKEYIAEISFGKSTDTGDSYGRVTDASDKYIPCADEVKEALKNFLGNVVQQTPAFSAVKINGQKSYNLARRGIEVPAKPRDIVIHDIEYLGNTRPESHLIRVSCGKGTYIRALCEDVGKSLGTPSFMSFLIRTKCARLDITDAFTVDELQGSGAFEEAVIPVDLLLSGLPEVVADGKHEKLLLNGGSIVSDGKDEAAVRVYIEEKFVGIGGLEGGMLKITTLLTDR